MEKSKKLKISIGLIYLTIVSLFLIYFFNKFEIEEVRSYEFIKSNREVILKYRDENYLFLVFSFFIHPYYQKNQG